MIASLAAIVALFQSSPGRKAGRYDQVVAERVGAEEVSILARP